MLLVLWWSSRTAAYTTTTTVTTPTAACGFVRELTEHLQRRRRRGVTRPCSRDERLPVRGGQRTDPVVANVVVVVVVVVVVIIVVIASNSALQMPFSLLPFSFRQRRQLLGAFSHEQFLPLPLGLDPLVIPRVDHCQCVQLRRHDPELTLRKAGFDEGATTKRRRRGNRDDEDEGNATRTTTRTPSAIDYQWY